MVTKLSIVITARLERSVLAKILMVTKLTDYYRNAVDGSVLAKILKDFY